MEHRYVQLARKALHSYLEDDSLPASSDRARPSGGIFVSLHQGDRLRGCVGTIGPGPDPLETEIAKQAVNAAVRDPRFPPLTPDEIDGLDITVYILDTPVEVHDVSELDPSRFGIVVEDDRGRRGLLLPDLPGVDTAQTQIDIARRKAGIQHPDRMSLYRFGATILH